MDGWKEIEYMHRETLRCSSIEKGNKLHYKENIIKANLEAGRERDR